YPSLIETLYTLGMSLTNDLSASLIAWLFGFMMILSILSFCKRYLTIKIGLLSATALCVTPLFAKLSIGTLVDMAVGYYTFLAFYLILIYHNTNKQNLLILSSIMIGLACATKHSGLVPFVVLTIWLLILEIKRRKSHKHWLLHIIVFFLIAFLIPTPWYIKSYINMGNPTVVYFTKIFGGRNLLPSDDSNMIISWRYQQSFQSESAFANIKILKLLWRTFFNDVFFWSLGVFFLMSIPLLLMIKRMNKSIKYGLLYSAVIFILYSVVTDQPRLIVPAFPFLFISASYAFHWAFEKNGSFAKILQIVVIIALLPNIISIARASSLKYPVVMGLVSREQYLSNWVDIYDTIQYVNKNLGDDVRILTIDPRGYYFDKPYIVGLQITQGFIRFDGIKNEKEMMNLLKTYGITHLLIKNKSSMTIPYIDKLIPRLKVIYSDEDVYLFAFKN
ncbi:MAG: ArnT family glycosyltransferase, partial [Candidatus Poribacteria bacterium]